MKLKYIIPSFIVLVAMLVGCKDDYEPAHLNDIRVSSSYLSISQDGGSASLTITANSAWTIENAPNWLTIAPASGAAGETNVTFTAGSVLSARTAAIKVVSGSSVQEVNLVQGKTVAETATCEQVIAGADGKTFRVRASITQIANTHYGNMYVSDGTGTVYIYGTNDKDGKAANDPIASWGLEVGDIVTLEGPKTTYNGTVELVNASVIKVEKWFVKMIDPETAPTIEKEGGIKKVKAAFKGKGIIPTIADDCNWIHYKDMVITAGTVTAVEPNPADTAVISFIIDPNEGAARKGAVTFLSTTGTASSSVTWEIVQKGVSNPSGGGGGSQTGADGSTIVSIADFNAAPVSTEVWYQLTGTVKNLKDGDQYGNFDLVDESGSVYVYGLLSEKGGDKKKFQELVAAKGIKEGSKITIVGTRGEYNGKIEVMNAYFISIDNSGEGGGGGGSTTGADGSTIITVADFNAAAESTDVWYQLTGTISNLKEGDLYGNFDLTDETGSVYVYGVLSEKGGAKKKFQELATAKGIANGKTITIVGNRGKYGDKIEVMNAYFISVK